MYEVKKNWKGTVGNGPSSYEKIIYRAAVSQSFRNTALETRQYLPPLDMRARLLSCTVGSTVIQFHRLSHSGFGKKKL